MTLRVWVRSMVFVIAVAITTGAGAGPALAAEPPVKLVLSDQFGSEVDMTTKGNVCTVISKDTCQPGKENGERGSISSPASVAGTASGGFYVAEAGNNRVEEFTAAGASVVMFGKEVNETTKGDICPVKTGDKCKAGKSGKAAGEFAELQSLAVDPVSGNVYTAETIFGKVEDKKTVGQRIQEFTSAGQFILEVGREVNKTTKRNICTHKDQEEGATCGEPTPEALNGGLKQTTEHEAFTFSDENGDILAVGGEHDLLYVGELGRIQALASNGEWKADLPTTGSVEALAVDPTTGLLFASYELESVIHEFDADGKELKQIPIGETINIKGVAIDSNGHLAVAARTQTKSIGRLYEATTGKLLPGFTAPLPVNAVVSGIGFDGTGHLYMARSSQASIASFDPEPVAEVVTESFACAEGPEDESAVTLNCDLKGSVNPYGVSGTEIWFEWGRQEGASCKLKEIIGEQSLPSEEASLPVSAALLGLRPRETICYRLSGVDGRVQRSEALTGETQTFTTPVVPPRVLGQPVSSFVGATSAVMFGELNPERSPTEYFFEYARVASPAEKPLASCPGVKIAVCGGVRTTAVGESELYRRTGVTLEAAGLQPASTYEYRLAASNEAGESVGEGARLTTGPAPSVHAETGSFEAVTATTATVSGVVDPDGAPAVYSFQLGVVKPGATTQFGTVNSGQTGAVSEPESLQLTGLQPDTEYAYRITISSGYGQAVGAAKVFRTQALAATLFVPPTAQILPVTLSFPRPACRRGYVRNKAGVCVKQSPKAKRKRAKKARKTRSHGARRRHGRGSK